MAETEGKDDDILQQAYVNFVIVVQTGHLPTPVGPDEERQRTELVADITRDSVEAWNHSTTTRYQVERCTALLELATVARKKIEGQRQEADTEAEMLDDIWLGTDPRTVIWPQAVRLCRNLRNEYHNLAFQQEDVIRHFTALRESVNEVYYNNDAVKRYVEEQLRQQQQDRDYFKNQEREFDNRKDQPNLPPRADGFKKFRELDLPSWKRMENTKEQPEADRSKASYPNIDGLAASILSASWEGGWKLPFHQGGMSTASLWIEFDNNNRVKDRVFKKEVYQTRKQWRDATLWDGDVRDANARVPVEIACHRDLRQIPSENPQDVVNVPQLRMSYVNNELLRYTMYLHYCGFGNLADLIHTHREAEDPFQEPFLWRVLESLSTVGIAMQRGHVNHNLAGVGMQREDVDDDLAQPAGWQEIVHRDLKPTNVFLDNPTQDYFALYPTPMLGDFGLAIRTSLEDQLNPEIFLNQAGTQGFRAPEQTSNLDFNTLQPVDRFPLCSKTNVWGIGMIMYSMATLVNEHKQPMWLGEARGGPETLDVGRSHYRYSDSLEAIINACIQFHPDDRPTFEQILAEVDRAMGSGLTQNRQNVTLDTMSDDEEDAVRLGNDDYCIGLTADDLEHMRMW